MNNTVEDGIIDQFIALFRGRGDAYGNAKGFCEHSPLTRAVFERHLKSPYPTDHIGVYCMVGDMCSWGCIDIDGKDFQAFKPCDNCGEDDCGLDHEENACIIDGVLYGASSHHDWDRMLTLALNLSVTLRYKSIPACIERTKNGYHVWVFPSVPLVPAKHMRRALQAACKAVGYDPKEVNPKAEGPRAGTKGLGNFVRLPYGGGLHPDWKPAARFMVTEGEWGRHDLTLVDFLSMGPLRTQPLDLELTAALWTPPTVAHHEVDYEAGLDVEPILHLLDGRTWTIWKDGPLPGSDRSSTLARLAYECAERGITATQAFAVVKSADERWGKFSERADCQEQLARFIDRAYE